MSCKILPRESRTSPPPIAWKHVSAAEGSDTHSSPNHPDGSGTKSADTNQLHNRVVELERELESEVRQARERGFLEGQKAARELAIAETQPVVERLLKACADVAGMRSKIRRETETDVVTLTIAIARRVLRRELSVDPEAIHGVIKAALEKVQAKEICLIRVHPDHLTQARAYFEKSGLAPGLEISADVSLEPGGVVVETKRGNLDASIETQLKEIERGFADRLGR